MTVSQDIINTVERSLFRRCFPEGLYPDLDACLSYLDTMTGVSDLGIMYTVSGTRASGDAHTSIANGYINRFVIWSCLRHLDPSKWDSFHEGDDGVIFLDQDIFETARECLKFASCLGFKLKVICPESQDSAVFCGRFTCTTCHREYCDLPRALSKFHTTTKNGDCKSLVLAKALSYFATDAHTPIMGVLCDALIKLLSPLVSQRLMRRRLHTMNWWDRARVLQGINMTLADVSPCCRASVSQTSGFDPPLQVAAEQQLAKWAVGVDEWNPIAVSDFLVDIPGQLCVY